MIKFVMPGQPQPKGSAKGFPIRRKSGAIGVSITSSNPKLKPWAVSASWVAQEAMDGHQRFEGPIAVSIVSVFERPQSLPKRVRAKLTKPDVDKLARAVLDAMTGIVFRDDAQVVHLSIEKIFGAPERTIVTVGEQA